MLLAINIGNTHVGVGLSDGNGWSARWRLAADSRRTADEYIVLLGALLETRGIEGVAIRHAAISSVVPALTEDMVATATHLCGRPPLVVGPGTRTGMRVLYDTPGALGTDRLVAAVAARSRFGAPVIVVDFGTATTFNVVDQSGAFAGGAIAPGVGIAAEALAVAGARLRSVDLSVPEAKAVVGRSTEHSMRAGVIYGYAGLVEGMLARLAAEMSVAGTVPVAATGGLAPVIAPYVSGIGAVEPDLALDGLKLIAELNGEVSWPTQ